LTSKAQSGPSGAFGRRSAKHGSIRAGILSANRSRSAAPRCAVTGGLLSTSPAGAALNTRRGFAILNTTGTQQNWRLNVSGAAAFLSPPKNLKLAGTRDRSGSFD
jgi:hypothetical protein